MGRKRKYASKEEEEEAKKVRNAERYAQSVNLGDQAEHWRQTVAVLQTHSAGLAKLLLDRWVAQATANSSFTQLLLLNTF